MIDGFVIIVFVDVIIIISSSIILSRVRVSVTSGSGLYDWIH
jgi:hypothetical protein